MRDATVLALLLTAILAGCGHSDDEMAKKDRDADKLAADLRATKAQMAQDRARYDDAAMEIQHMTDVLRQTGLVLRDSKEESAKLRQALTEYKLRAEQLESRAARPPTAWP